MKKILLLAVVLFLLFCIVGCWKDGAKKKADDNGVVRFESEGYDENMEVEWK